MRRSRHTANLGRSTCTEATGNEAQLYDAAEFLETDEDIVAYFNAALEDSDPPLVAAALDDMARAVRERSPIRGISRS